MASANAVRPAKKQAKGKAGLCAARGSNMTKRLASPPKTSSAKKKTSIGTNIVDLQIHRFRHADFKAIAGRMTTISRLAFLFTARIAGRRIRSQASGYTRRQRRPHNLCWADSEDQ